jgi:hypothetical protein
MCRDASSVGFCLAARLCELGLHLLRDLGQLGEDVDRLLLVLPGRDPLQLGPRPFEPLEQLLGALEGFLFGSGSGQDATFSRSIRARIPLTSLAASSEA